jgi:hypothetical protein
MTSTPTAQGKSNTNEFLKSTYFIDCEHPEIAKKAHELTRDRETDAEKAKALFEFVRDAPAYDWRTGSFVASEVLGRGGGGVCHQRSLLLTALCRVVGIPARLHLQKVTISRRESGRIEDLTFAHGVTGIYLDGDWHLYETTGTREQWVSWTGDERRGADMPVEFHPDRDCLFTPHGRVAIETLPVYFADLTEEAIALIKEIDSVDFGYDQLLQRALAMVFADRTAELVD